MPAEKVSLSQDAIATLESTMALIYSQRGRTVSYSEAIEHLASENHRLRVLEARVVEAGVATLGKRGEAKGSG